MKHNKISYTVIIYVFFSLLFFSSFKLNNKKDKKHYPIFLAKHQIKRIVIDAGHGGKDPGALGTGRYKTTEADVVLDIAIKLEKYINTKFPDVEVIMTRNKDVFVEVKNRSNIANKKKADLFISLHCNSNTSPRPFGAETYILGMHKTKSQLEVAKRENQVIFLEKNYKENYKGFDPNSPESMIAIAMMQKTFLDKSINFAKMLQYQFKKRVSRKDRGIKQAGFWVISRTVMPAVLIELGFISNHAEEDFLNSDLGKTYLASAIYRAFKKYKISVEGYDSSVKLTAKNDDRIINKLPTNKDLIFKVQLFVSSKRKKTNDKIFQGIKKIEETKQGKLYKYTIGNFNRFEKVMNLQAEIRDSTNFKDAFSIAVYKGNRISISKALKILNKKNN